LHSLHIEILVSGGRTARKRFSTSEVAGTLDQRVTGDCPGIVASAARPGHASSFQEDGSLLLSAKIPADQMTRFGRDLRRISLAFLPWTLDGEDYRGFASNLLSQKSL
jgi:hypothetical protein